VSWKEPLTAPSLNMVIKNIQYKLWYPTLHNLENTNWTLNKRPITFHYWSGIYIWGMWQRSWLRHCVTSQKIVGSFPDSVIGIFRWHKLSGHTMALGLTHRNECQEYFLGGNGGQCIRLTTLPPSCAVLKSGSLNLLEPSGTVQACNGIP
jgi:hypothetical protein